jgi:hypothetical protein
MFSWFRRKRESSPRKLHNNTVNPGHDATQVACVTGTGRELYAELDLVRTADRVFGHGYSVSIQGRSLVHAATGFVIRPLFVKVFERDPTRVGTTTTIEELFKPTAELTAKTGWQG